MNSLDEVAVKKFRKYIQIPSVHPNPDYSLTTIFFKKYSSEIALDFKIYELVKNKPIIILTLIGTDPSLPSILLNSHVDVVPVSEEMWEHPPFSGHLDGNGDIHGRGTQDMKCVSIQHLEALRRIKKKNVKLERTIHISLVPDEEIGGKDGMKVFCESKFFEDLNVGFVLDEGLASETDTYRVFYAEKSPWWIEIECPGDTGHGSMSVQNNAAQKIRCIINSFLEFREKEEKKLLEENDKMYNIVTVNLTCLRGGDQPNVIPEKFVAVFDMRIPPTYNFEKIERNINLWVENAGQGVKFKFLQKNISKEMTNLEDDFWKTMKMTLEQMGMKYKLEIFPGSTDSRFIRKKGIPSISFSPIIKTQVLLHNHNEKINRKVFLDGVNVFVEIIKSLGKFKK